MKNIMETQKQTQPELQLEAPRTPKRFKLPELSHRAKNIITAVGLGVIALPFTVFGVAAAYDSLVLNMIENSLAQNVAATHSTQVACEASYQALLKYKQENNIAVKGTGSPCPLQ